MQIEIEELIASEIITVGNQDSKMLNKVMCPEVNDYLLKGKNNFCVRVSWVIIPRFWGGP